DAVADRFHQPGKLEAGDVLRRAGRGRVVALALHQVGPIQTARPHPNQRLLRAILRPRHVANLDNLRTTRARVDRCTPETSLYPSTVCSIPVRGPWRR